MRKVVSAVVMAVLLLPISYSYGFSTKGEDCSKCHSMTKEEASTLLKDLATNLNILDIRTVPVKGMWEVDVEAGGKKGPVYIDFSKKYMISGSIISLKDKRNLTQERLTEINKVDVSQIPLDDALVMGDKGAKYKIIVFDDPE